MFGCLLLYHCIVSCHGIFSPPTHHESPYMEKKYTVAFNSTWANETYLEKLTNLNGLAHDLVDNFDNRTFDTSSLSELEGLQSDMNTLHVRLEDLHQLDMNRTDHSQTATEHTDQLYLDTINTIIKFNEIVSKLL
uniref:Uncharacterized protein n=1 Tax=Graphocephala atropunctata TaxID=36148 RepID=A0A1B6LMK3_9HEMI